MPADLISILIKTTSTISTSLYEMLSFENRQPSLTSLKYSRLQDSDSDFQTFFLSIACVCVKEENERGDQIIWSNLKVYFHLDDCLGCCKS